MSDTILDLSEFLQPFPNSLSHHRRGLSFKPLYVFWSDNNNSSSSPASLVADEEEEEKVKSALGELPSFVEYIAQFWAVVSMNDTRLLSTCGQPFATSYLNKEFQEYRLYSEKCMYMIDNHNHNHNHTEGEHMITISTGGPATAFINRFASFTQPTSNPFKLSSIMLPICLHISQTSNSCIGVLEFTIEFTIDHKKTNYLEHLVNRVVNALKRAGLDVFSVKHSIPYKTINGLILAKDDIEEALKIVCESHNIDLAQVWINDNNVPFTSLKDAQTKRLIALKLTGCNALVIQNKSYITEYFDTYYQFCDVTPRGMVDILALKTLQDYKSRYSPTKYYDEDDIITISALEICLRGYDTGDCNFVFEFLWIKHSNSVVNLFEALLLTLKRCLPRFKFASGAELDDELDVLVVESGSADHDNDEMRDISNTNVLKIFQRNRLTPVPKALDKGKQPMLINDKKRPYSEGRTKTAKIELSIEEVKAQYGKTLIDAAKALGVSRCTLRRWWNDYSNRKPWPGPKQMKRSRTNENVINRAIQEPLDENINQNTVTIKAEYDGDMIKFSLPVLQVGTFAALEKEINRRFKLSPESYKLKYRDEKDLIRLSCDEDINDCINYLGKYESKVVRVVVVLTSA